MKTFLLSFVLLSTALLSVGSYAQSASGIVQEVKICGADNNPSSDNRWVRVVAFRIEDKWFGIWHDRHGKSRDMFDYDNNGTFSLIMMAFSQSLQVNVRATDVWNSKFEQCAPAGHIFHDNPGDYIHIIR